MTDQHPITPPPELIRQWNTEAAYAKISDQRYIATQAARWAADIELDACLQWFSTFYCLETWMQRDLEKFRSARRPTSNRSHGVIDRVWTYMTDEAPATHTQAELAVEAVEMWLRHQGQTEAAELIKKSTNRLNQ